MLPSHCDLPSLPFPMAGTSPACQMDALTNACQMDGLHVGPLWPKESCERCLIMLLLMVMFVSVTDETRF